MAKNPSDWLWLLQCKIAPFLRESGRTSIAPNLPVAPFVVGFSIGRSSTGVPIRCLRCHILSREGPETVSFFTLKARQTLNKRCLANLRCLGELPESNPHAQAAQPRIPFHQAWRKPWLGLETLFETSQPRRYVKVNTGRVLGISTKKQWLPSDDCRPYARSLLEGDGSVRRRSAPSRSSGGWP